MFVNQLFEGFDSDYSVHLRATRIIKELKSTIENFEVNPENIVNSPINKNPAVFIKKFKDNIDIGNVRVLFGIKDGRANGSFMAYEYPYDSFLQVNIFNPLDDMDDYELMTYRIKNILGSYSLLRTLYHEVIHAIQHHDGWLSKSSINQTKMSPQDYYNSSAEFDAYYHNIVEHYMSLISDLKKNPNDIDDYVDIYDISLDFNKNLKTFTSGSNRLFLKHLTGPRHKRLLKRLYNLHTKLVEIIKNKPIKEDFSSDQRTAGIATDITKQIQDRLKKIKFEHLTNHDYWTYVDVGDGTERPCFATDLRLGGDYKDVNLCLFIEDAGIHGVYVRNDDFKCIGLFVLPEKIRPSFEHTIRSIANDKRWINSIYHEVIHLIQDVQNKISNVNSTVNSTKAEYYNDAMEFDAFFHQISDVFFKTYKELENNYQHGLQMMKEYGIVDNFEDSMVNILTDTSNPDANLIQEFISHLNTKRYKRILKRFYNIHSHLMKAVKNGDTNDQ